MSIGRLSIRARLLLGGVAAVTLSLLLAAWGLAILFDRHAARVAASDLGNRLVLLVSAAETDSGGGVSIENAPRDPLYERPYSGRYWQVAAPSGMARSRSLWDYTLQMPEDAETDALWLGAIGGPLDATLLAVARRIDVATPEGDVALRFIVAMDQTEIAAVRSGFLADLAPYLLILAVALLATLAGAVGLALRPLSVASRRVAELGAGRRRRMGEDVPSEVLPLADRIDALLAAREAEVERARQRAGDLAHGLKTPLQALLGEAARLSAAGAGEAARGIETIAHGIRAQVDRELARVRRVGEGGGACDPLAVAEAVAEVLRRTPRGAVLDIDATGPPGLTVAMGRADLAEALGALAENAVRHARCAVSVRCTREEGGIAVRVRDDGPGVEEGLLSRLTERGLRLDENSGGSGLGLAIAAEAAAAAGGSLVLCNMASGFEATLVLPKTA